MRKQLMNRERGMSLVIVALGLAMIMGLAGMAIDLASLYVTRNEEQRAADAAALAGADTFVTSGITIGLTTDAKAQSEAATKAVQVGNANLVIGRSPALSTSNFNLNCPAPTGKSGGCFNFSNQNDPRITVVVQEQMPTYFMKLFGIKSVPVSASATAEAYQPTGSGPSSSAKCVKPWMMPNCDYNHMVDASTSSAANEICPAVSGLYPSYFVYPETQPAQVSGAPTEPAILGTDLGTVVNPTLSPTGAIGELMTVKTGNPSLSPAPSQFYPVFLPGNNLTFECPSCALSDQQNSTSNSAARYREFIECCSNAQISCGSTTINPVILQAVTGNKVGPTGQGVDCLIHESPSGTGQDTISWGSGADPTLPYTMYAGSANPYYSLKTIITSSDSVVTVPLYNGHQLCPGGSSCPSTVNVNVEGWLQLFIQQEGAPEHTVYAFVLSIATCGGTNEEGGTTTIPSTTGSPIPVRLIHN